MGRLTWYDTRVAPARSAHDGVDRIEDQIIVTFCSASERTEIDGQPLRARRVESGLHMTTGLAGDERFDRELHAQRHKPGS